MSACTQAAAEDWLDNEENYGAGLLTQENMEPKPKSTPKADGQQSTKRKAKEGGYTNAPKKRKGARKALQLGEGAGDGDGEEGEDADDN